MLNIVHFEIPADDIQRAKTFYANLFGWKIESMQGMDYMIIDPYSVPGGGNTCLGWINDKYLIGCIQQTTNFLISLDIYYL